MPREPVKSASRPKTRRAPVEGCQIGEIFHVLSKAHMLDVIHFFLAADGPRRFVDVQSALALSPNTLSDRLRELVGAGLLTRTAYNEIPPRVDYAITEKALELRPVFDTIEEWAVRHKLEPAPAPAPRTG